MNIFFPNSFQFFNNSIYIIQNSFVIGIVALHTTTYTDILVTATDVLSTENYEIISKT